MKITEFLTENRAPIRLFRNPNHQTYRQLASIGQQRMVRALIDLDNGRDWYCWPGQAAMHMDVIEQTGMDFVIPVRIYGVPDAGGPGEYAEVEITDTRFDLPKVAEIPDRRLHMMVTRFLMGQKLFKDFNVKLIADPLKPTADWRI